MKYILLACLALMAVSAAAQTDTTTPQRTTAGYSFPHHPVSKMSNPPIQCMSEHIGYTCKGDTYEIMKQIFYLPTVKARYLPPPVSDTIACEMLVSLRESGSRAFYMTGFVVTTMGDWSSSVSEYLYPNKKPLPREIKVWLCTYEQRYKPL